VPMRHPVLVTAARHLGLEVKTLLVADPESKGGSEASVRVAKARLPYRTGPCPLRHDLLE